MQLKKMRQKNEKRNEAKKARQLARAQDSRVKQSANDTVLVEKDATSHEIDFERAANAIVS